MDATPIALIDKSEPLEKFSWNCRRMCQDLIGTSKILDAIVWYVVALPVSPAVVVTGEHINFLSLPAHQSR